MVLEARLSLSEAFSLSEERVRLPISAWERLRLSFVFEGLLMSFDCDGLLLSLDCEPLFVRFAEEESAEDSFASLRTRRWELELRRW